ncbi:fibronectin type III domain-containing protein [Micromonospora lupini]|uniref:fibronectin type III domain-containing protein n=1 Tax=Micromonospora lupini TaxID=285679 RepID=UPI003F4CEDC4
MGDRYTAGGESTPIVSSTMSTAQGELSGFASASTEVFPAVGPAPAPPQDTTAGPLAPATYPPPVTPTHPPATQYPAGQQYPGQPYQQSHEVYPGQRYQQDTYSAGYADEGGSAGRSRATLIGTAVAAGVALVAVAGLGAVVLNRDDAPPPPGATVAATPSASGPPPGDLKLRDDLVTITLTWTDPSGGAVPFMVAGGRAGLALGVMATVEPGRTSHTVNGLSSRVDYCFTVLAVYSTDSFATSGQVCTNRERSTPPS